MSDHRHATDRSEVTLYASCPEQHTEIVLDGEGRDEQVDELIETIKEKFPNCSTCGEPLGTIHERESTEVLE
ncbi:hypothetical protein [Halobaculum rubrum]|uniref:hypothetical protein n=1 Tax=Halobaculum rubrum TaxID=2872158 RepID=UPI001CA3ED12|nr:hypothetical protein [Halobaculum rubrum]QZX98741.1 hypothetical protein K6T25_10695 [Halobaculum rubrum]